MSNDKANEGIIITGGSVSSGSIAAGRKAQAVGITLQSPSETLARRGQEDLAAKIETLLAALQEYEGELEDRDAAFESAKNVVKELEQERPANSFLRKCLAQLSSAAGSVTAVAKAVAALDIAVTELL